MSAVTLEDQIRQLIAQLTPLQKLRLIEWLGANLAHDLSAIEQPVQNNGHTVASIVQEQKNGVSVEQQEDSWTSAAMPILKKPMPKTGAEIVAWLEANPDTPEEEQNPDNWADVDIQDVAVWVHNLRRRPRKTGA